MFWSDLYVFSKLGDRDPGIHGSSGINAATALTVGILGFPGILVLYGLAVYHML
ncbi:MAG: pro-sigmaK processing inhibitor BofA family protein [Waltera sp.]